MEKLLLFLNSIDWIFAAVLLMAGRYLSGFKWKGLKSRKAKFLVLSLVGGAIYLLLRWIDGNDFAGQFTNFFLTFLFVNTFYSLVGRPFFEMVEAKFTWMSPPQSMQQDDDDGPGSNPGGNPPPPPPGT